MKYILVIILQCSRTSDFICNYYVRSSFDYQFDTFATRIKESPYKAEVIDLLVNCKDFLLTYKQISLLDRYLAYKFQTVYDLYMQLQECDCKIGE